MHGMREVVAFLNEGERENEGRRQAIQTIDASPGHLQTQFRRLFQAASQKGTAVELIGEHLALCAFDDLAALPGTSTDRRDAEWKQLTTQLQRRLGSWRDAGDFVLPFDSLNRSLVPPNYLAPYSIFPIPTSASVRLASGAMRFIPVVNVSAVLRYFAEHGWLVVKTPWEHADEFEQDETLVEPLLATLRKGRFWTKLSSPVVARLGFEGLRLGSLLKLCEGLAALDESGTMEVFPVFRDEAAVWD